MRFGKRTKDIPHLEITSLIDIIFILLIFFMISSTFIKPAVRLKLPVSATRDEAPEQEQIILTLSADDQLYLDGEMIHIADFQPLLRERYLSNTNVVVLFYGDKDLDFEKFLLVVDILKSTGIKGIAIGHDQE